MSIKLDGPGKRILADFSTLTPTDNGAIQTSVNNGNTSVYVLPNGNGTHASVASFPSSNPTNSPYLNVGMGASYGFVESGVLGSGQAKPLRFLTNLGNRMEITINGEVIINPQAPGPRGILTSYATIGPAYTANFAAVPQGTGQGQGSGMSFYGTFNGTNDNGPRRTADIYSGYGNGAWGNEYLSLAVGGATDAGNLTNTKMIIGANGNVSIGMAQVTDARLRVTSSNNYTNWSAKEIVIETLSGSNPGIGFHAQGNSSAGILKYYGGLNQFECRNDTDTGWVPMAAGSFQVGSDYRLKEITGPVTGSGEFIDTLQPKQGTWKKDGSKFVGLIAHEVQAISPSSVMGEKDGVDKEGNPIYQTMDYSSSEIMAMMIAELQALRRRVAELEAKHGV